MGNAMGIEGAGHDGGPTRRSILSGVLAAGLAGCATASGSDGGVSGTPRLLGHRRHGRGPEPVVVLHEWLGDHSNYDPMLPYLPENSATWILADLRGYGWSKPVAGAYSLAEAATDVMRLMDHYGHGRFHVVGHSMSGMVAQYLAAREKARVKSVVAISPVPASGFRADATVMKALMAIVDDDTAARAAIDARVARRYGRGWLDRKLSIARNASNRDAMIGYLRMFTGTDVADQVRGTPTPVTVLVGAHDIPLYREDSIRKLLGPLFPNLQVEVSREAGHYAMLETPALLAGVLERGIARGA